MMDPRIWGHGSSDLTFTLRLNCHCWRSPIQGEHLGQTTHEKEGKAGLVARSLYCPLGSRSTLTQTEDNQMAFFTRLYLLFFLHSQSNSYSHQGSIATIHLDVSNFYNRGINSFSVEVTVNPNVLFAKLSGLCVRVWPGMSVHPYPPVSLSSSIQS